MKKKIAILLSTILVSSALYVPSKLISYTHNTKIHFDKLPGQRGCPGIDPPPR